MNDLAAFLAPLGLMELGRCAHETDQTLVLIGPDEPDFWPIFTQSAEYKDGDSNALDRWSRRVLTELAHSLEAEPRFPFGGPPYSPFFSWALKTGRFWASPIQFLVHDTAGLFVSFRGALILNEAHIDTAPAPSPCLTCAQKPCLTACPVEALGATYDVPVCKSHLATAKNECMSLGCAARRSCPIGQGKRLPAQATFHMEAFL